MTMATIQERRAAYRKRKEAAQKEYESVIEAACWRVTMGVLKEFPKAELTWQTIEDHPDRVLGVKIRLGDYAVAGYIAREHVIHPDVAQSFLSDLVRRVNQELSKGSIRHLFVT